MTHAGSSSIFPRQFPVAAVQSCVFYLMVVSVLSVSFSVAISSISMSAALVFWILLLIATGGKEFHRSGLEILFVTYLLAECVSSVLSMEPANSFFNMKRFFLISFLYLSLSGIGSRKRLLTALIPVIVTAAIFSFVELFFLSTSAKGHILRLSLFQYFLTEGGIKMMILLLAVPFVIHQQTPRKLRILFLACMLPLFVGLVLTQTRSSWLGVLGGLVTIGSLKNRKLIAVVAAVVICFALLAPQDLRKRAATIADPTMSSNLSRLHMITTGWRMFLDRPFFGFGDVDLRKYYVTYTTPLDDAEGGHLHNNIMQLLVTLGIVGFSAVMIMFIKLFLFEFAAANRLKDDWLLGSAALGSLGAYIGFHINGLFEWNFGDHEIAVLFWFSAGIAMAAHNLSEMERTAG